jgi:ubiquinol-cytochrome c reductase cytochrome b subunit
LLRQIQNKFGGSIKKRTGVNAIRYRLQNKQGMLNLVKAVNGNIRNSTRLKQFYNICSLLEVKVITPIELTFNNA